MSEADEVQQCVLETIRVGRLPRCSPQRTWAGRGTGATCAICIRCINSDEVEFELEFAKGDSSGGTQNYSVHSTCFVQWESARQRLELASGAELPDVIGGTKLAQHERDARREQEGA